VVASLCPQVRALRAVAIARHFARRASATCSPPELSRGRPPVYDTTPAASSIDSGMFQARYEREIITLHHAGAGSAGIGRGLYLEPAGISVPQRPRQPVRMKSKSRQLGVSLGTTRQAVPCQIFAGVCLYARRLAPLSAPAPLCNCRTRLLYWRHSTVPFGIGCGLRRARALLEARQELDPARILLRCRNSSSSFTTTRSG
jgi:hypothetical protein